MTIASVDSQGLPFLMKSRSIKSQTMKSQPGDLAQPATLNEFGVKGGAYTNLMDLVQLRYTAKQLDSMNTGSSRNPLSGLLTSNFRGRGIDFAEVRLYQPGDDIRTIDWRVTARTRKPHTKMFQEEREKPVLVLVDQSASMFFGSRKAFKSVVAAETAALLAWSVLDRGDRVGGLVFSEKDHREIKPRRSKHAVLHLLNEINQFNHQLGSHAFGDHPHNNNPQSKKSNTSLSSNSRIAEQLDQNPLNHALRNTRRVAKHGSTLFILSDFQQFDSESQLHLSELSKHNDVTGLFIFDPLEQHLPAPDLYSITNGTTRARIDTSNSRNRQIYQNLFDKNLERIQNEFNKVRAPLFQLRTDGNPVTQLIEGFHKSLSRRSMVLQPVGGQSTAQKPHAQRE